MNGRERSLLSPDSESVHKPEPGRLRLKESNMENEEKKSLDPENLESLNVTEIEDEELDQVAGGIPPQTININCPCIE